ncbi:unnamed protein product [Cochlearia groenlandica]
MDKSKQEEMILRMHMERSQQLLMQQQQQQQSSMFPSSFDSRLRPQGLIHTRPVNPSLINPNLNPNLIQQQQQIVTNQQMMIMHQQQREREQRSMMLHQQRKQELDQQEQRSMMMMMQQHHQQKQQQLEQRTMMNLMMMKQKQEQEQQQQKKQILPLNNQLDLQFSYQDAWRVCHPDFKTPFSSLEDACERLLPYHVVSDYEAEEDDKMILDSDTTGQPLSRTRQWDNNIAAKVAEYTATFEKQAEAFNIITRERKDGELRTEERLSIEQLLLQDERTACADSEMKARDERLRMSALAHIGQVKAAESRTEMMRANAIANRGEERRGNMNNDEMMMMTMMNGWRNHHNNNNGNGNVQRVEKEPL